MLNPDIAVLPTVEGIVPHGEYFYFSKLVYDTEKLQPIRFNNRWSLLSSSTDPDVGLQAPWYQLGKSAFFAAAYISHQLNCVVIAVQGSNSTGDWTHHNPSIFSGTYPESVKYLEKFYLHVKSLNAAHYQYPISFTGHSQGALCAEVIACTNNLAAVTFESPGSMMALYSYAPRFINKLNYMRSPNILSYVSLPNIVNRTEKHIGLVVHLHSENVVKIFTTAMRKEYAMKAVAGLALVEAVTIFPLAYCSTYLIDSARYNLQAHSIDNFSTLLDGDPVLHICEYWPLNNSELEALYKKGNGKFSISKATVNLYRIDLKHFGGRYYDPHWNTHDLTTLALNYHQLLPHFRNKDPDKIATYLGLMESFQIVDGNLISNIDHLNVLELYFSIKSFFSMLDISYYKYFYAQTNPACRISYQLGNHNESFLDFRGWRQTGVNVEIIPKSYFGQPLTRATIAQLQNFRFDNTPLLPAWRFSTANPQAACEQLIEIANTIGHPAEANNFRQLAEFIRNTLILGQPIEEETATTLANGDIEQGVDTGPINYEDPLRSIAWKTGQGSDCIFDILVLADGKFLTADGHSVCLWDPHSDNIDIRVTRWGVPCRYLDHSCAYRLIPIGNYVLVASDHFCSYINLATEELIQTPLRMRVGSYTGNIKFLVYRNKYIITSLGGHGAGRNFTIWNIETQQEVPVPPDPSDNRYFHGVKVFHLLKNDLMVITAAYDTEQRTTLWRIRHTEADGIQGITEIKTINGINVAENSSTADHHANYSIAWLNRTPTGNDVYATLYGISGEAYELRGIAIFDTNGANSHITKISVPYVCKLFDIDQHHFLTVGGRNGHPRYTKIPKGSFPKVTIKLWRKSTRTVISEYDFEVRRYSRQTIQQVIKLSDTHLALNTLEGIKILNLTTGACQDIEGWQQVNGHSMRTASLAVLNEKKIVIGAARPKAPSNDNLFLYEYS